MYQRYRDDHLHLLACAAARRSIDVQDATTVGELLATIQSGIGASALAGDRASWLRVWGYDDALLVEQRHPTVAELDAVTGDRPAVLHHITGHVAVANTAAGRELGLGSGDVLVERHDVLARTPKPDRETVVSEVAAVLADLAAASISECTDATHTNDLCAVELLADAVAVESSVSVTAMVGADRLASLGGLPFGAEVQSSTTRSSEVPSSEKHSSGETWKTTCQTTGRRSGHGRVRIGHAKVMPPHDDDSAIGGLVAAARAHGFPVAIHVMDIDTLQVALDALEAHPPQPAATRQRLAEECSLAASCSESRNTVIGRELERLSARELELAPDRIEHCSLALPEQLDRIARLGVTVVTQPSFVTRRERKYRERLSLAEQQWLWPLASLLRRGIRVALSSDAPTVPADPAEWIQAATCRDLAPAERVDEATARGLCLV